MFWSQVRGLVLFAVALPSVLVVADDTAAPTVVTHCDLFPLPPVTSAVASGDDSIDVMWDDSELASVVEYRVRRSHVQGGPYETVAVVPDSSPGFPGGAGYVYEDDVVSGAVGPAGPGRPTRPAP
jgi:hypothetical protein